MILQALNAYYERLAVNSEVEVPLFGYSREKIHFCLELNPQGEAVDLWDLREPRGKRLEPKLLVVPEAAKKTNKIVPNFCWGNSSYVFGVDEKGKPDRSKECFESFREYHRKHLGGVDDAGARALCRFLESWKAGRIPPLSHADEVIKGGPIVFRLEGERRYLHEHGAIKTVWEQILSSRESSAPGGTCLITGKSQPIARIHPSIKNVRGAQSSGASLVSFNLSAFQSFGKEQNYNAPIGVKAAFAYTTALNHLLAPSSRQKVQIGDASVVFWAEEASPIETVLGQVVNVGEDSGESEDLRVFLETIRDGRKPPDLKDDVKFFVLGVSPNAARLSVRFWYVSDVGDMSRKIGQHFRDLRIAKEFENQKDYPSIWHLLRETAPLKDAKKDAKNIPPVLVGEVMYSILTGRVYPRSLLSAVIGRIRANGKANDTKRNEGVNYYQAAIIKAYLVRRARINRLPEEVGMNLNKDSTNVAYRLGRLFAVLEKAQKDAVPGAKATIKDRFYGAASATPRSIFPQLLRLAQHHMQKSDYGVIVDQKIEEILSGVAEFPPHLPLEEQGLFALGYYHQKRDLYQKAEREEEMHG